MNPGGVLSSGPLMAPAHSRATCMPPKVCCGHRCTYLPAAQGRAPRLPVRSPKCNSQSKSAAQQASTSQPGGSSVHGQQVQQDQQEQRAAVAEFAATSGAQHASFASISRGLLSVAQPQNLLRNLAQRKFPAPSGPVSLMLFLLGLVLGVVAAVHRALIHRVKSCRGCKGYGITRCKLCDGSGVVAWRAKLSYSECCPLCMRKRYVVCPDCGGFHHKRMFSHTSVTANPTEGSFA